MPKTATKTFSKDVGEVMATGLDPLDMPMSLSANDPVGLDTPLDDAEADATEPTATEKAELDEAKRDDLPGDNLTKTSDRGAVGRLVADLLSDPDLSYEAIVDRVKAAHPTALTTARSVASTASVMRRHGSEVPVRRRAAKDA